MQEVIIIGAGPAGAYLAYLLARKQVQVLVLEKEHFPRHKPCGGGLTARALDLLEFDVRPVIEDAIKKIIFTHGLKEPVTVTTGKPVVYTVNRRLFDAFLVDKAEKASAVFLEGTRVKKAEIGEKGVFVHTEGKVWQAKILAGADGASSITAKNLGLNKGIKRAATLEYHHPLSVEKLAHYRNTIKIEYGMVPTGYAWIFPKASQLSLGVGSFSEKAKNLPSLLHKLAQAEDLAVSPEQVNRWIIPLNPNLQVLHSGPALVLGDAAGLADPFTGEGIYSALLSASLASEVIAEQVRCQKPDLREYTLLVKEKIGIGLSGALRASRWLYPASGLFHRLIQRRPELAAEFASLLAQDLKYTQFLEICRQHIGKLGLKKVFGK